MIVASTFIPVTFTAVEGTLAAQLPFEVVCKALEDQRLDCPNGVIRSQMCERNGKFSHVTYEFMLPDLSVEVVTDISVKLQRVFGELTKGLPQPEVSDQEKGNCVQAALMAAMNLAPLS